MIRAKRIILFGRDWWPIRIKYYRYSTWKYCKYCYYVDEDCIYEHYFIIGRFLIVFGYTSPLIGIW